MYEPGTKTSQRSKEKLLSKKEKEYKVTDTSTNHVDSTKNTKKVKISVKEYITNALINF